VEHEMIVKLKERYPLEASSVRNWQRTRNDATPASPTGIKKATNPKQSPNL